MKKTDFFTTLAFLLLGFFGLLFSVLTALFA
jgi:hypothetical protein